MHSKHHEKTPQSSYPPRIGDATLGKLIHLVTRMRGVVGDIKSLPLIQNPHLPAVQDEALIKAIRESSSGRAEVIYDRIQKDELSRRGRLELFHDLFSEFLATIETYSPQNIHRVGIANRSKFYDPYDIVLITMCCFLVLNQESDIIKDVVGAGDRLASITYDALFLLQTALCHGMKYAGRLLGTDMCIISDFVTAYSAEALRGFVDKNKTTCVFDLIDCLDAIAHWHRMTHGVTHVKNKNSFSSREMIYNDELFQKLGEICQGMLLQSQFTRHYQKSLHFDSSYTMPSTISFFTSETVEAAQLQYVLHLAASYENGSSGREKKAIENDMVSLIKSNLSLVLDSYYKYTTLPYASPFFLNVMRSLLFIDLKEVSPSLYQKLIARIANEELIKDSILRCLRLQYETMLSSEYFTNSNVFFIIMSKICFNKLYPLCEPILQPIYSKFNSYLENFGGNGSKSLYEEKEKLSQFVKECVASVSVSSRVMIINAFSSHERSVFPPSLERRFVLEILEQLDIHANPTLVVNYYIHDPAIYCNSDFQQFMSSLMKKLGSSQCISVSNCELFLDCLQVAVSVGHHDLAAVILDGFEASVRETRVCDAVIEGFISAVKAVSRPLLISDLQTVARVSGMLKIWEESGGVLEQSFLSEQILLGLMQNIELTRVDNAHVLESFVLSYFKVERSLSVKLVKCFIKRLNDSSTPIFEKALVFSFLQEHCKLSNESHEVILEFLVIGIKRDELHDMVIRFLSKYCEKGEEEKKRLMQTMQRLTMPIVWMEYLCDSMYNVTFFDDFFPLMEWGEGWFDRALQYFSKNKGALDLTESCKKASRKFEDRVLSESFVDDIPKLQVTTRILKQYLTDFCSEKNINRVVALLLMMKENQDTIVSYILPTWCENDDVLRCIAEHLIGRGVDAEKVVELVTVCMLKPFGVKSSELKYDGQFKFDYLLNEVDSDEAANIVLALCGMLIFCRSSRQAGKNCRDNLHDYVFRLGCQLEQSGRFDFLTLTDLKYCLLHSMISTSEFKTKLESFMMQNDKDIVPKNDQSKWLGFLNALNKIDIGMLKQCVSLVDAWRESRYKDIVSFLEKTWLTDFMQADKGQRSLLREACGIMVSSSDVQTDFLCLRAIDALIKGDVSLVSCFKNNHQAICKKSMIKHPKDLPAHKKALLNHSLFRFAIRKIVSAEWTSPTNEKEFLFTYSNDAQLVECLAESIKRLCKKSDFKKSDLFDLIKDCEFLRNYLFSSAVCYERRLVDGLFSVFATLTSRGNAGFFKGSAKDLTALVYLEDQVLGKVSKSKSALFSSLSLSTFICDAIEKFKGLKCKQEQERSERLLRPFSA